MQRFYVGQTQPGQDAIADAHLRKQSFEIFAPFEVRPRTTSLRHPWRSGSRTAPLFPGYLFVKFDVGEARWRSINGTRGMKGLLGPTEAPTPVPVGIVEDIQARFAAGEFVEKTINLTITAGDRVTFTGGNLRDRTGTCAEVCRRWAKFYFPEAPGVPVFVPLTALPALAVA